MADKWALNHIMKNAFENVLFVCRQVWHTVGIAQRVSIILIFLLGVSAIGLVLYAGTRPDWHPLYSDLDQKTAARVYELVQDEGIPVRLKNFGRTILVPHQYVNDLRLKSTEEGIEVGRKGSGFELFDNAKLGLTELQQHVGYQRALQGELERMIGQMPGVDHARVVLVMTQRRAFQRKEDRRGKATVMTVMRPGHALSSSQVASIRHMVASGVVGIDPTEVTVTDQNGQLLARGNSGTSGFGRDPGSVLEIQEQIELGYREKAEAILRPVVGINSVVAMVTAEIDFEKIDRVSERYDADNSVVVSERAISEDAEKPSRNSRGVVGTGSNLVSIQNPGEATSSENKMAQQSSKTIENKYIVPKVTETIQIHNPRVRSLSVAVTIAQRSDGTPRTEQELTSYRELVRSAVGADNNGETERKNVITVVEGEFVAMAEAQAQSAGPPWTTAMMSIVRQAQALPIGRPLVGLVFLFILYRLFGVHVRGKGSDRNDLGAELLHQQPQVLGDATTNEDQDGYREKSPRDVVGDTSVADPARVAAALENYLGAPAERR